MSFDAALQIVLIHEGGYVNDPRDPGGETRYGISKRAYPHLDIASLTVADASSIYRRDYWDACRCGQFPAAIGVMLFDTAVNMGCDTAIKFLQKAVGAKADGIVGPKTLAETSKRKPHWVLREMAVLRMLLYTRLPGWQTYSVGWTKRAFDVFSRCLLM